MLLNADASQLEWRSVVHLSGDKTGRQEIENGIKFHKDNQIRFGLPKGEEGYLAAKVFLFRAIYKGSAYAYAADPIFAPIGGEKFWQGIIDKFYEKYSGIQQYHDRIIREVVDTGRLVVETGRIYTFEPRMRKGEYQYSETDICNYPVQGHAADIMAIVRAELRKVYNSTEWRGMLREGDWQLIWNMTVHDSIVLDTNCKDWYNICIAIDKVFKDVGVRYQELFGCRLTVPMACEVKVGNNWKWMHRLEIK